MAQPRKYTSTPEDPMPFPELNYMDLKKPENLEKKRARDAWTNRQSYRANGRKTRNRIKKTAPAPHAAPKSAPTPPPAFKDDSAEFRQLLAQTPINEPFTVANLTEKEGIQSPPKQEADDWDEFDEFEEPAPEEQAPPRSGPDYVNMTDAKAYLFVRLANFGTAIMTRVVYWCIGYDTDMEAMKLSDKDVETMAEDAKWFIDDIGMSPQSMFMTSMIGTVAMNGFYTARKQAHPWWEEKPKQNTGNSGKGPFKMNINDTFSGKEDIPYADVI